MMRRGFTLIELLIAIAVIAALIGLLLPALNLLRRAQKKSSSQTLARQLAAGVDAYLHDHRILGDLRDAAASDFAAKPLLFLMARRLAAGKDPYLDVQRGQRARDEGGVQRAGVEARDAEFAIDHFLRPYRWTIVNDGDDGAGGRLFTKEIEIRSLGFDGVESGDDVGFRMEISAGRWYPIGTK